MRTGRNGHGVGDLKRASLDHWDMRTGRNVDDDIRRAGQSLDHWDMRTGRNWPANGEDGCGATRRMGRMPKNSWRAWPPTATESH